MKEKLDRLTYGISCKLLNLGFLLMKPWLRIIYETDADTIQIEEVLLGLVEDYVKDLK